MIPKKNRKEWKELVTGQIDPPIKSFYFKMKVKQARNLVQKNANSLNQVVDDLYDLCNRHINDEQIHIDFKSIFGQINDDDTISKTEASGLKIQEINKNADQKENESYIANKKDLKDDLKIKREALISTQLTKEAEERLSAEKRNLERIRKEERQLRNEIYLKEAQETISTKRKEMLAKNIIKQDSDLIKKSKENERADKHNKKSFGSFFRSLFVD